jgi:hypothetical protein
MKMMSELKRFVLGCVFAGISVAGCASPANEFSGEWGWNNASGTMTFSIDLKQRGDKLLGQYCAVAQNGNKTDCDDEENPNISGIIDNTGKSATVNFFSFFGAKNGKAIIKVSDGRLVWHIVKKPSQGEFYAPKDAIMEPN